MPMRDLVPWSRGHDLNIHGGDNNPGLALRREMNRLFENAFRAFDLVHFESDRLFDHASGAWPNVEVSESDTEIKVTAELPGIDEKDVRVDFKGGLLVISGEKKTENEDKERRFSERTYGRFERRIPIEDVDEDKISAAFKNGVLTIALPKAPQAQAKVKRIAINGN